MIKNFEDWNNLKQRLEHRKNIPTFKEREIWWCSIGVNIGCEEDGKNQLFNRPILIIRKFNNNMFLGAPLTTKQKNSKFYYPVHFAGKDGSVMISQIRVLEGKRLTHKMGTITKEQFDNVRKRIREEI